MRRSHADVKGGGQTTLATAPGAAAAAAESARRAADTSMCSPLISVKETRIYDRVDLQLLRQNLSYMTYILREVSTVYPVQTSTVVSRHPPTGINTHTGLGKTKATPAKSSDSSLSAGIEHSHVSPRTATVAFLPRIRLLWTSRV